MQEGKACVYWLCRGMHRTAEAQQKGKAKDYVPRSQSA